VATPVPAVDDASPESALVVIVPEAEPLVAGLRRRHDPSAAVGVPAHVTVLYPFVPPARLDDAVRGEVRDLFATRDAFDYRFERVERLGDATVILAPEPATAFSALIGAATARWPAFPPYGGAFETVIPHLTIGDRLEPGASDAVVTDAERALARLGPVTGRARTISLLVEHNGRWYTDSAYALRDA
jgi:hypothetical protein